MQEYASVTKDDLRLLPLGTEVVFNQVLKEDSEQRAVPRSAKAQWVKTWVPHPLEPQVGAYIGYRYLQEGYTQYTEDGKDWVQLRTVACALIVTTPRKNPVRVPISSVEVLA
jgi:hypothetical protein